MNYNTKILVSLAFFLFLINVASSSSLFDEHVEEMIQGFESQPNETRRNMAESSCKTGNPIDDCWRCDPEWDKNREKLADCAMGFGAKATGGKGGKIYVVTDPSDEEPMKPKQGTLRFAVTQKEPLWIIFEKDMKIVLKEQLVMFAHKTIDGRGANVDISGGGCITIQKASNVIIHGLTIHDCKPTDAAKIHDAPSHTGLWEMSDGDAISVHYSKDIWIDHCTLSKCDDGLVDITLESTGVTISNNLFMNHDKAVLLGHDDAYTQDKVMQASVILNRFGEGLHQRMPRCRHGNFHVANNDYLGWQIYAVGGSAAPTIYCENNRFRAPSEQLKEVTMHSDAPESEWKNWNWKSVGDLMLNGAFFRQTGSTDESAYSKAKSGYKPVPADLVATATMNAGVLPCKIGSPC